MITKRFLCLLLAVVTVFMFCACGAERIPDGSMSESGTVNGTAENEEELFNPLKTVKLSENFVSITEKQMPDAEFSAAYRHFTAEIFAKSRVSGKNSLISPLSVIYALAMTFTGAEGETLEQFLRAFDGKGDIDIDRIGACLPGIPSGACRTESAISVANSIWVKNTPGLRLKDDFVDKNRRYYQADIYAAPFNDSTLQKINGWVSANTYGRIKQILEKLNADAVMCLVNAILFDARWKTAFERTEKREFNKANGDKETVEMMYSDEFTYIKTKKAVGFEKKYSTGYSFIAVLPDGTLEDYMATFDGVEIANILSARKTDDVSVGMPSFEYDFSADLIPVLQEMGVTDAFTGAADFSGISEDFSAYISQVVHKTRIEVTAEGTTAAAATAVEMTKAAENPHESKSVVLNRPFLYMIIGGNDTPLFIGTFEG